MFIQRFQDLSNRVVHLQHEVAVWIGSAFALELIRGQDGGMRSREGEIKEKGLILLHRTLHRLNGFVGKVFIRIHPLLQF